MCICNVHIPQPLAPALSYIGGREPKKIKINFLLRKLIA